MQMATATSTPAVPTSIVELAGSGPGSRPHGGFIDLHCHALPGVDDGPRTLEAALDHLATQAEAGVELVVCTPHVRADHVTDVRDIPERVDELGAELGRAGIGIELRAGGELAHPMVPRLSDAELELIAQGPPGSRWLLFELPFEGLSEEVQASARELSERGYGLVLAHPERVAEISPAGLVELQAAIGPSVVQLTAASLVDGTFGIRAQRLAIELVAQNHVCVLASDSHGPGSRTTLREAHRWLCETAGRPPLAAAALTSTGPGLLLERGLDPSAWPGAEVA